MKIKVGQIWESPEINDKIIIVRILENSVVGTREDLSFKEIDKRTLFDNYKVETREDG